jgi:hypothetical protein
MAEAKTKIIDGESFQISQPYTAGHTLTEIEARVLNQVRSENIGNNLRSAIKDAKDKRDKGDSADFDKLADLVAQYDAEYTFATPGAGGSTRKLDPVEREALALAKDYVKADLAKKGRKVSQVPEGLTEDEWKAKLENAYETVAGREEIIKLAKQRVAQKQKVTADLGDIL